MVETPRRGGARATYEDLLRVPAHLVAEILDGTLVTSPRPAARHARASSVLGRVLGPWDESKGDAGGPPGGWWILDEPELHLGDDVLVPDLAGWRRERMPVIPDVAAFELYPDWICEVISPRTERIDRVIKMRIYAREKVPHLWLIEPVGMTLEVYALAGQRWMVAGTYGGDDHVRAEPFEALEIELGKLWLPGGETPVPGAPSAP